MALPKITAGYLKHRCRDSVRGASKALSSGLRNGVREAISHSVAGGSHLPLHPWNANDRSSRPQPIVMCLRRDFMAGSFFPFAIFLLDFPLLFFAMEPLTPIFNRAKSDLPPHRFRISGADASTASSEVSRNSTIREWVRLKFQPFTAKRAALHRDQNLNPAGTRSWFITQVRKRTSLCGERLALLLLSM